jgi:predicted TIM-barrel fold metal-dependent hydrolase
LKIDVFNHVAPQKFLNTLLKKIQVNELPPTLNNLDIRFKFMDKFEDLVQVISLSHFDFMTMDCQVSKKDNVTLCKLANDEMAEMMVKHPDRFVGVCASVPMTDIDATLKEIDRAIIELGFCGIQLFTIQQVPLDAPEFRPVWEKMNYYNLPVVLHPTRSWTKPEYPLDKKPHYLSTVTIAAPFLTTLALNSLVFSGIMEDFPNLKILSHHCGGLVPFLANRIEFTHASAKARDKEVNPDKRYLPHHPIEYFHKFYGDTITSGNMSALRCGIDFFGVDHILFATDAPFDNLGGIRLTDINIRTIEQLGLTEKDKYKIYESNAIELFRLPLSIIE